MTLLDRFAIGCNFTYHPAHRLKKLCPCFEQRWKIALICLAGKRYLSIRMGICCIRPKRTIWSGGRPYRAIMIHRRSFYTSIQGLNLHAWYLRNVMYSCGGRRKDERLSSFEGYIRYIAFHQSVLLIVSALLMTKRRLLSDH